MRVTVDVLGFVREWCPAQQPTAFISTGASSSAARVSRVVAEIFQQRIVFELGQPAVSLFVGTFQPIERFVGLPAKRIHLSNLIGGTIVILRDKPSKAAFES